MATQVGFQLESTLASKHLLDSNNIKGSYYTVEDLEELNSLPIFTNNSDGIIVDGCFAYVNTIPSTGKSNFYYYKNNQWNELIFNSSVDWDDIENKPDFFDGDYNDLTNKPTIPTDTTQLTNGAGFLNGTVAIANGGTGASSRLNALKNLTNENVGTSAQHFLTITDSWGKGGYTSVANAKTVLGLGSAAYINADTANTVNTIARRDANGYLRATYYNQSSNVENINSYSGPMAAFFSTDGWLRKTSIANFKTAIGLLKDVPANAVFTDTNTTYSAASNGGLSLSGTEFSLANSGVTAGSYGPSANATPSYGSTFNVPYITVDAKGRVTAASTKTVKIPSSDNTNTVTTLTGASTSTPYGNTTITNLTCNNGALTATFGGPFVNASWMTNNGIFIGLLIVSTTGTLNVKASLTTIFSTLNSPSLVTTTCILGSLSSTTGYYFETNDSFYFKGTTLSNDTRVKILNGSGTANTSGMTFTTSKTKYICVGNAGTFLLIAYL